MFELLQRFGRMTLDMTMKLIQFVFQRRASDLFRMGIGPFTQQRVLPVSVHGVSEEPRSDLRRMFRFVCRVPLAQYRLSNLKHGMPGQQRSRFVQGVFGVVLGQLRVGRICRTVGMRVIAKPGLEIVDAVAKHCHQPQQDAAHGIAK